MSASMESYEFILFYKYFEIENDSPAEVVQSQQSLCTNLHLNGRVRVSKEGMNGILSGSHRDILSYKNQMDANISDIQWYNSGLVSTSKLPSVKQVFDTLSVKLTKEVVSLDIGQEKMSEVIKAGSGIYLEPTDFHKHLKAIESAANSASFNSNNNNAINEEYKLIDVRNQYEVRIGTFKGENFSAINPETRQFSDIIQYFDDHLDEFKDKKVLMYCTGGVRCERASAYLKYRGVEEVYHLKGGIHAYQSQYGANEECYFKGKNFVFDPRQAISNHDAASYNQVINDHTTDLVNIINDVHIECVASTDSDLKLANLSLTASNHAHVAQSSSSSSLSSSSAVAAIIESDNIIGRCSICLITPCDDYSNQIRCCKCRMLILVCPSCEDTYKSPQQTVPSSSSISHSNIMESSHPTSISTNNVSTTSDLSEELLVDRVEIESVLITKSETILASSSKESKDIVSIRICELCRKRISKQ